MIGFNDGYNPANMELDEFTVGLVSRPKDGLARPNGDLTRYLNVVDFDKVANTITVKYGGAYSGEYKVSVTSKLYGSFNSKLKFNAVFEFTDFEPKEGSKYGGQLVTITGGHFSSNP